MKQKQSRILAFCLTFLLVFSLTNTYALAPASSSTKLLSQLLKEWVTSEVLLPGEFLGTQFPKSVGIVGVATTYPSRKMTNQDLVAEADRVLPGVKLRLKSLGLEYRDSRHYRDPAAFEAKGTGITSRQWFDPDNDIPSEMAAQALIEALEQAGYPLEKITWRLRPWLIGVSTYGAELLSPGLGPLVNRYLNLPFPLPSISADAVCPGWIAAVADLLPKVATGMAGLGLIPVLEYYSRYLRPDSGSSWPIFGDMAAGTVLAEVEKGKGILWGLYQTDGKPTYLSQEARGKAIGDVTLAHIIKTQHEGFFGMHGQAVGAMAEMTGEFAVKRMAHVMKQEGLGSLDDVNWFVFHQANKGLILKLAKKLGIEESKLVFTMEEFGNTSAASIPLTLDVHRAKFKPGDLVFMGTFGGGFQWGALLVEWSEMKVTTSQIPLPLQASLNASL